MTGAVLVAGGRGFLGSHLVRRLAAEEIDIHATSRGELEPDERGVRWWRVDLADLDGVRELFRSVKPDTVFNLAGFATGAPDLALVPRMFRDNLATTVNLLTAAAETGCRRMFNARSFLEPEPEDSEGSAGSPYAASKWAAAGYARMFHALYGLPVVDLRVFMTYGPAQRDLNKLVPHVTLSLLRGEAPKLTSGRVEMDWVYVDDVVDGCLAAAEAEGLEGQTLDIGSGQLCSARGVVERLVELTGSGAQPLFGSLPDRPQEPTRVADTATTHARLGWSPSVDIDEGLARTVEWYREQLDTGALR